MQFTHFNAEGQASMVDIGDKAATIRRARACGHIVMQAATLAAIDSGDNKKGDVLGVARIAAIQAAKRTDTLIPLCHSLALSQVVVEFRAQPDPPRIECCVEASCRGATGVEMEALTAVTVALLTIYDMCKAVDRGMQIEAVRLLEKSGGRSGHWQAPE